jgi:hypothetical protein
LSGNGHAVLWLGILLIGVRLFTTDQWSAIWNVLTNGQPVTFSGGGGGSVSGAAKTAFPGTGGKTGVTGDLLHAGEDLMMPAEGLRLGIAGLKLAGG